MQNRPMFRESTRSSVQGLRRPDAFGFTLVDLLVTVSLLALLASVAVPAIRRHMIRSRSLVVLSDLQRMCAGAVAYYEESAKLALSGQADDKAMRRFPSSTAITPTRGCCTFGGKGLCEGTDWDTATWRALGFEIEGPHRFRYQFVSAGVGAKAAFSARAFADLDCDGVESTFERVGRTTAQGRAEALPAVHVVRPGE